MNAATNQPSIPTLRLGQSDQAGHVGVSLRFTLNRRSFCFIRQSNRPGLKLNRPLLMSQVDELQ